MMIGTRCHISFLQFLPKKPMKFGIKVFVKSESKTGYVLTFQIYTGKKQMAAERTLQKISVGHRVVKELLERYLGKGHWVFTYNYYTSVDLYQWRMTLMQLARFEPLERTSLTHSLKVGSCKLDNISMPHPTASQQFYGTTGGKYTCLVWHIIRVSLVL